VSVTGWYHDPFKTRERDIVDNKVPENVIAAEKRPEMLRNAPIREVEA
jgi:hypothetical protein